MQCRCSHCGIRLREKPNPSATYGCVAICPVLTKGISFCPRQKQEVLLRHKEYRQSNVCHSIKSLPSIVAMIGFERKAFIIFNTVSKSSVFVLIFFINVFHFFCIASSLENSIICSNCSFGKIWFLLSKVFLVLPSILFRQNQIYSQDNKYHNSLSSDWKIPLGLK